MATRTKLLLAAIWLIFVVRGVFYCFLFPVWEGFDEPYHFAYIQHVATHGTPPDAATPISREVEVSLGLVPLPWMLRLHALPDPHFTHDDYWRLPAGKREELQSQLRAIPDEWAKQPASLITNYEAQQPPLYYSLFSVPLRLAAGLSLASQVILLRVIGVIVASLIIPLGHLVALRIFQSENVALASMALVTAMPELMINLARVSNEVLAVLIYTALVYFLLKIVEGPGHFSRIPVAGALLGLGLITKAYFLSAIPAFYLLLVWCIWEWPPQRKRLALATLAATVALLAVAGPWYWHVHALTGSWSGEMHTVTLRSVSFWQVLAQIPHVNWISGLVSVLLSHIWFGNWSFLRVANAVYLFFAVVIFVAIIGLAKLLVGYWRRSNNPQQRLPYSGHVVALLSLYGCFVLALAYHVLITYVAQGASSSAGWYLYAVVIPEVLLLWLGLCAVFSPRLFSPVITGVSTALILLDLYGVHFLLAAYYSGRISHDASGKVVPASMWMLREIGFPKLLERLSINKPELLASVGPVIYFGYLAATLAIPVLTWFLLRRKRTLAGENKSRRPWVSGLEKS